jgi:FixJ family two-component response regulator
MNDNSPLICVIDDESAIRESVSFLLHSGGTEGAGISSAQEFLTNPPVEALGCLVVEFIRIESRPALNTN